MYTENERGEYGAGGFLAGLLTGAAMGVAIGMAFAPRSGAEMRRQLADSSHKLREQASGRMGGLVSKGREVMERRRQAREGGMGGGMTGETPTGPTSQTSYSSTSFPTT